MGTTVFGLLLLGCCLCGGKTKKSTTSVISSDSQQYVHVVSLAQLSVKVNYLQRENEAQAVKLRELEQQKSQVDMLKTQLQAQAAALASLKANSTITESKVEALQKDVKVKQVAFSASLLASGHGFTGPYNAQTNLVFKHVTTNIGNAYNPHTGVFTAPVRGVYHFQFYVGAGGHASIPSGAVLVKNGHHIFIAYERQKSGYGSSSNGVSLLLEVGDVVFLHLWQNARIYDDGNHHSTFSGHLLFTM
ncbi:complement C1q-like protein 2 isoform X3 [Centroberyx affinis]|uniref:complement C1q-like protein 2 isoform X3 n=1 Tax=Centroberyx affinis TaxID=166261 RepID=UPI003A5BD6A9